MEEQIKKLKELNDRLTSLLADPEPGIAMWAVAVARVVREMARITGDVK